MTIGQLKLMAAFEEMAEFLKWRRAGTIAGGGGLNIETSIAEWEAGYYQCFRFGDTVAAYAR